MDELKKKVKVCGNSLHLRINSEDCEAYGIKEGDILIIKKGDGET